MFLKLREAVSEDARDAGGLYWRVWSCGKAAPGRFPIPLLLFCCSPAASPHPLLAFCASCFSDPVPYLRAIAPARGVAGMRLPSEAAPPSPAPIPLPEALLCAPPPASTQMPAAPAVTPGAFLLPPCSAGEMSSALTAQPPAQLVVE